MADFTGNIHSVTFMDYPQNTLLEILYKDPHVEREGFTPWHMEVDFTNNDFTELLQEWSLDKIERATKKDLLAERAEFDAMVDKHIQDKWEKEEEPKLRAAYDAVDEYAKKQYEMLEQDGRQIYKAADEYGEKQKNKKYQEVQEEFKAYRKELQGRYQDVTDVTLLDDMTGKDLFDIVLSKGTDNDFIFAVKIAILEDPIIAKSKDKALKLNIRKSKNLWDLFKLYFDAKG
tara:strand:+ start:111 stop:803 length:693 start_codon:yes stop_codon:yes gene_type:complete